MHAPRLQVLDEKEKRLPLVPVMPKEPVLPLSVKAYHALLKAGVLEDGDPVELLEGFLVPKMTKGAHHAAIKRRFLRLIDPFIPSSCFVDTQEAITATDSEPEPDIYIVHGPEEKYDERHPGPGEVEVVVEISESSLRRDRGLKKRIYARSGVPTYWIINLIDRCVEVFTQPGGEGARRRYGQSATYRAGDKVPLVIGGKEVGQVAVIDILGSPEPKKKTRR